MIFRVTFKDVGRDRMTWTSDLPTLSWRALYNAIKNRNALRSKGVEFSFDDTETNAEIYAGFCRVGSLTVERMAESSPLPVAKEGSCER